MINILFVSCYSTDINNSASIELIYYMNLLAETGDFNIHLLTLDFHKESIYYDSQLIKLVNKNITIHRVDGGFILKKLLPKKSHKISVSKAFNINKFLINIKNKLVVIDPYTSWSNIAYSYFKKNLKDIDFDIILGMHEPPSSLICAYKIKRFIKKYRNDVKLVSYFSDPYCEEKSRKNKGAIIKSINKHIENNIIKYSDKFLFVTHNNLEYYRKEYNLDCNSCEIIHRGFDEKVYSDAKSRYPKDFDKNKINVLHAGDIVKGIRNINEFIKAMDSLEKDNDDYTLERLNINFFGNIHDDIQLNNLLDKKYMNFKPRISYSEILDFIVNSDILIIFGNSEFSQIPAKIYDYMGSNAYILAIHENYNDPLYDLIKNVEGVYCCTNDYKDIRRTFINIMKDFTRDRHFLRSSFNSSNVLDKLCRFLKNT